MKVRPSFLCPLYFSRAVSVSYDYDDLILAYLLYNGLINCLLCCLMEILETVHINRTVTDVFIVRYWNDLEISVQGHWKWHHLVDRIWGLLFNCCRILYFFEIKQDIDKKCFHLTFTVT